MAVPPDFVAGQVLTAAQMNKIGLWLVKTQTIGNAVSSVTVSDAFSADYENYRILLYGGVGSTAQDLNLQLGSSTTGYYFSSIGTLYSSNTVINNRSNNGSSFAQVGFSGTTTNGLDATLFSPFKTIQTGLFIGARIDNRTAGAGYAGGNGFHDVAASYTSFTLTVPGTMTGGVIYVYGFRD